MNIRNIAIVRATNVIPFDGEVYSISESPYLYKAEELAFSFAINDLLKKKGLLKEVDNQNELEADKARKENSKILQEYIPYNSNYNSMVLWALNGIVPDDNSKGGNFANNVFSNKDCAIIDGLEEQFEQSEIISLIPTDTAIKGSIKLSDQATILLRKERYESLSQEEKDKLASLDLRLEIFEGDLTQIVNKTLNESGRYTSETLSLARDDNGYIHSATSDEVIQTIDTIARENGIAQEFYYNILMGDSDYLDKLDSVKNEYRNIGVVQKLYTTTFFEYLFSRLPIDNGIKSDAMFSQNDFFAMYSLCEEIDRIGVDEYKTIVDKYNRSLEILRDNGQLPTPQQIVDAAKKKEKIDLLSMIEGVDRKVSAGEVEEVAKTAKITDRDEAMQTIVKEKEDRNKSDKVDLSLDD